MNCTAKGGGKEAKWREGNLLKQYERKNRGQIKKKRERTNEKR